jgi:mannan endo-1,4-beta-mannosidase
MAGARLGGTRRFCDHGGASGHDGTHLGNIQMELTGLRGEYFANTNLSGTPARVLVEGEPDFDWGHGSPHPSVPTNYFSARWIGVLQAQQEGEHVFFVSADAGAAFQLRLAGELLIDNWTAPATNAVEWSAPYTLYTNYAPALVLEYIEFTDEARVKLAWTEPAAPTRW